MQGTFTSGKVAAVTSTEKNRCTCKKFDPLDVQCTGEMYKTSHPLTCPMHSMAYKIECEEQAAKAEDVIHPEMGRGHSNYPQARNNVLISYAAMFNWTSRLALPLKKNPEGLSSVPQARSQDLSPGDILPGVTEVQSLKERLSAVVKSHLRENFMEFSALPATNTTRRWVPAVQYTPVELLDRRQAPYGQKRRKIVSDRYAKLIFWLQPEFEKEKDLDEGHYVGIVKAKIKFFDYRGGGQYTPTQKASELVDPKYVYLVDFPTRNLMGEKTQVDNMEEIIKQYKSEKQQRLKAIISSLNTKNPTDHKTYVVRRDNVWRALKDKLTKKNFDVSKMVKVKFTGEEDTLDFGGPQNEMFRMALQGIFETSGLFEHSPHGYLPISSPIAIVNGYFKTAGKAMAMPIVHLGPTPSCLHPAIVSALCGENLPDMSGFQTVDQEAAAFVAKMAAVCQKTYGHYCKTCLLWQRARSQVNSKCPTTFLQKQMEWKSCSVGKDMFHEVNKISVYLGRQFTVPPDYSNNLQKAINTFTHQIILHPEVGYRPLYPYPQGVSAVDIEPLSEEPNMDMGRTWVREDMLNTTELTFLQAVVSIGNLLKPSLFRASDQRVLF
ncbi:hypothetical protein Bbelb_406970 [Branchiostoma belcheri]|nr:hypothetical protein Bbelb_406970 [Branchiostoma belcheri]